MTGITIDPSWGYCHPRHSQRTKCACGEVIKLGYGVAPIATRCDCGRLHAKEPGNGFAPGDQIVGRTIGCGQRPGGKKGCPGI